MILLRRELGDVLRDFRMRRGETMRTVSTRAHMALSYLSDVERGQKEVSSEILADIAWALDTPVSEILRVTSERCHAMEELQSISVEEELDKIRSML